MTITVFTKPACPDCKSTKDFLDRAEIEYNTIDAYEEATAFDFVVNTLGVKTMPAVVIHDGPWWEFKPEPDVALNDQPSFWIGLNRYRLMQLERQLQPVGA